MTPRTRNGRLAAILLAVCAAIFAVAIAVSLIANDRYDSSAYDTYRFVVGTGFLLTGAGALVSGLVAIVRDRDRAVLVFATVALGLLAVAFALGDVVFE